MANESFLWGAATSGHQIEGNNIHSDWWAWEAQGNCEGGIRSGAATDHWNRFREDIRLAAELGLNSYRFSIEWSRIEPEEGRFDREAMEWYRELIAECEKHRLLPMLTLHHFTSPLWFADRGGFAWDGSPKRFAAFTRHIAASLGPHVPLWCTLNEPMVLVVGGYLGAFMPPAKFDPKGAATACHNLLRCHVEAYRILHSEIRERKGPFRAMPLAVGIAQNMLDFIPDRRWHPAEWTLTRILRRFYNRSWLDAVTGRKQHFGVLGLMPYAKPVPEALGNCTADFIGVNYYTKAYVQWRPRNAAPERPAKLPIGVAFARRKEVTSDLEWAIHPEGLARMLRFVKRYGLPIYITENGIADHRDLLRPQYLIYHLNEIARAIEKGIDVRGYFHWSLIDNFEWVKGFGPRFGLYRVNFETYERSQTGTALLLKKLIDEHRSENKGLLGPNVRILDSPDFATWRQKMFKS